LLPDCNDKRLKLDIVFFKPMRIIIIAGFVIALASGMFLNYAGHPWQVLAQTQGTQNATQGSSSAGGGGAAAGGNQTGGNQTGGGGKSTTPPSTVKTVKGGPKAAGSASQLQQIEGPNASKIISSGTPIGNKPGLRGLTSEGNATSLSNATSQGSSSAGGGGGGVGNATGGAAGSAANKTSAGASSAGQNATSAAQGQNNTNPLAKIPVIGKLFGGQ
jgi:hypothetical protein